MPHAAQPHEPTVDDRPPILIEYRDLVRCSARLDEVFAWKGWGEDGDEDGAEILFVHHDRLGCFRKARRVDGGHRGCAGMPFPFGDFLVILETSLQAEGRDLRIECEVELFFFGLREARRRDLWSGRLAVAAAPDGSLSAAELGPAAGVLDGQSILRRLHRRLGCGADPTCWQVLLGTTVLDAAMAR